jgi:hypothetical protein
MEANCRSSGIGNMDRVICLVAQNRLDLVGQLKQIFGPEGVEIVIDRRRPQRRRKYATPCDQERRQTDRRIRSIHSELHSLGFALIGVR